MSSRRKKAVSITIMTLMRVDLDHAILEPPAMVNAKTRRQARAGEKTEAYAVGDVVGDGDGIRCWEGLGRCGCLMVVM